MERLRPGVLRGGRSRARGRESVRRRATREGEGEALTREVT